jgi:hypothetical protein
MAMKCRTAVMLFVMGSLALAGCKGGTPGKNGGGAAGMVDAVKLCDEYKAGEAAADKNYNGKEVQVQGKVLSVRPDPNTKAKFVMMKGSEGGTGTRGVRCYFTADQQADVEKLKGGDDIKVKGMCKGKMGGTTGDSFDVMLENCKLVK